MPISGKLYSFTEDNVNQVPAERGVYQLFQGNVSTYIGRAAGDGVTIRSRLKSHFNGNEGPCTQSADSYKREVTSRPKERERELISEYENGYGKLPLCNDVRP